jgi:hypothetical protein
MTAWDCDQVHSKNTPHTWRYQRDSTHSTSNPSEYCPETDPSEYCPETGSTRYTVPVSRVACAESECLMNGCCSPNCCDCCPSNTAGAEQEGTYICLGMSGEKNKGGGKDVDGTKGGTGKHGWPKRHGCWKRHEW